MAAIDLRLLAERGVAFRAEPLGPAFSSSPGTERVGVAIDLRREALDGAGTAYRKERPATVNTSLL